ncbi:UDP-N-acetylglucosamine 2-epimerase [Vibrio parahaemolyticus]|uniref:UDP-N-acetylglucosamine 2-epimerase n=1 Tax=Vibrio parahaemolyticus TaxID=670 RepID=A0A7M1WEU7_VIBPH|nr:UDP-N-acetylglucosamine 2-epimerase [Vibrio parahaemolyticus]EGR1119509.1 UDP-N-acetylglucosamine 2-epimerase (hydrolyzing) [Vibrio parahaemolyticus]EQM12990.1 UDP-N-acetyl-D-glucosamine 2-epimerase, UDP-hydrolysing [Vibrio parahaemolyticus 3259]ETJ91079.1 UDP-N-acetyl-D-glucosamine 2-epimerase, UDP-hydrolysing [Vibrio parahaemolyticus EKP-008]QOS25520.1 UDP-N-acetylglucosamine 2-epimerase [Vibrio parahaemolyticus]HCH2419145.1 UDP-N-acetylglucosamine 2-epimerase (hydrolyzing) [Vibrio paraha
MKKVLFLTGTRADFGKLKSLITKVEQHSEFEAHIFITGMHMIAKYGMTAIEVEKAGFKSLYKYINQNGHDSMDVILSKTILGLSDYVKELKPDMLVVHGDRVEAMAGATVGALNNILVAHIEGGEVSGTIDELIRHSVTKMSHLHFVSNNIAKERLLQLGESESSISVIGSPDLDIMASSCLPSINDVKERYEIPFNEYSVFMYHPVTTELEQLPKNIKNTVDALIESDENFVVIYPNNDHGSEVIINELSRLKNNDRFRVFPSIRFEYFLTLLKNTNLMIGNSSAGVREVPFYGKPSINLGTRQHKRSVAKSIFNIKEDKEIIKSTIATAKNVRFDPVYEFGDGKSDELFIKRLESNDVWLTPKQKIFNDKI